MTKIKIIKASLLALSVALALPLASCGNNDSSVISGEKGEKGDKGDNGTNGKDGVDGKDGINGKDGSSVLTGNGIPSNELGNVNDSYINLDTFDYYVKEESGWSLKGNIKGSNGVDGTNGKDGVDGKDGINGTNGIDGANGKDGTNGTDGKDGIDGENGKSAYEIYKENYPSYPGTEKDWIKDLALGKLSVTVHFETNGGTEVEDYTFCKGEEVKISQVTSKDDYAFTGWYLDEETTTLSETEFVALENITLYAGFHPNSVSVTYIVNDTIYLTETYDYATSIKELKEAPTRLGYTFNNWKANNEDFDINKALTSDVILTGDYSIEQLELPYIEINTENKAAIISKEEYVNATISIGGTEDNKYDFSSLSGKVKGRGNSTWGQPKKPYKIKFDKKQSLFGSTYKAKSWVLLANYFDKSLSRNAIAYELASRMNSLSFSPERKYVDVYLNGTYVGVYLLTDQIETGDGRVDICEDEAEDGNTGYLMELDQPSRIEADGAVLDESYFKSNGYSFAFKTPDIEEEFFVNNHSTYINYIRNYMDSCFTAMNGSGYEEITNLIDVESFAETYLVQELFANNDCGYSSFYIVKDKDGKLEAGPVWDFDIGAGNINYNMGNSESCPADKSLWASNANIFFKLLLKHNEFKELVTSKIYSYEETFNEVISLADSTSENGYYTMYKNALNRNFDQWKIMGTYVWPEPNNVVSLSTVSEQMDFLYNWLTTRYAYMKTQYPQNVE